MSFEVGDSRDDSRLFFCLFASFSTLSRSKSALPPSHLGIVQINLPSALGLASVQLVAPRRTCLCSGVVCYRKALCLCSDCVRKRVFTHRTPNPTIFDCHALTSVCSRLLPPLVVIIGILFLFIRNELRGKSWYDAVFKKLF